MAFKFQYIFSQKYGIPLKTLLLMFCLELGVIKKLQFNSANNALLLGTRFETLVIENLLVFFTLDLYHFVILLGWHIYNMV